MLNGPAAIWRPPLGAFRGAHEGPPGASGAPVRPVPGNSVPSGRAGRTAVSCSRLGNSTEQAYARTAFLKFGVRYEEWGNEKNDTPHKVDGLVFEVELALLLKQSSNRKPGSNDVRTRFLGTPKGARVSSSPLWWAYTYRFANFSVGGGALARPSGTAMG